MVVIGLSSGAQMGGLGYSMTSYELHKWRCTLCGKLSASKCDSEKHMRVHTGERPFCCKICHKTFNDRSVTYRHLRNIHQIENAADYLVVAHF